MPRYAETSTLAKKEAAVSEEEARNRLEDLADILLDLQSLTSTSGGPTVNGLLALAHAEAALQAKRTHQRDNEVA